MNAKNILNKFAEYLTYKKNQTSGNSFDIDYAIYKSHDVIEQLLSGYNPTGELAVIYAKNIFMKTMQNSKPCCNYKLNSDNYNFKVALGFAKSHWNKIKHTQSVRNTQ